MRLWHDHREPESETARQGTVMKGVIAILLAGCPISTSFARIFAGLEKRAMQAAKKTSRETA